MTGSSSPFPIEIEKIELRKRSDDRRGGTKSYHILRATNAEGRSLVVQRWGKTGVLGQMQTFAFASKEGAQIEVSSKRKSKQAGGYEVENVAYSKLAHNEADLKLFIGPQIFFKLGVDHVEHLVPGIDAKGVTDGNHEPTWVKDPKTGRYYDADPRKPRMIEETKPAEPTLEERIAKDELWGTF